MNVSGAVCDTSVLVPALASWHPQHERARRLVALRVQSLPGPVVLECYSVLTRLPSPHRVSAEVAERVVTGLKLSLLTLPADAHLALIAQLAESGVRGGAVYDGVIAAIARHHGLALLTSDRRARPTYEAVGASYEMV